MLVSRTHVHTVIKLLIVTTNWSSVCIPSKVIETEKIKDKMYMGTLYKYLSHNDDTTDKRNLY
jgi:hypothetical protein